MHTLLQLDHIKQLYFSSLCFRNLADMESDGKMDRQEFSIAMKLIKLKLQGRNLPSVLPITMKQTPVCNAAPTIRSSAGFGKDLSEHITE